MGKSPVKERSIFNNVFFYLLLAFLFFWLFQSVSQESSNTNKKSISELFTLINEEKVQKIQVDGDTLKVDLRDGTKFISQKESVISFDEILKNNNIDRTKIQGGIEVKVGVDWV